MPEGTHLLPAHSAGAGTTSRTSLPPTRGFILSINVSNAAAGLTTWGRHAPGAAPRGNSWGMSMLPGAACIRSTAAVNAATGS